LEDFMTEQMAKDTTRRYMTQYELDDRTEAAYRRGMADGLETASNQLTEGIDMGQSPSYIAGLFWQESKRVREMGVNNENTQ
jgi:hypothetical protein